MAQFRISGSFSLESRRLFVLAGNVVEGVVRPGMLLEIPFNTDVSVSAPIHSVEYIRHSDREELGLCIQYADENERDMWGSLNLGDDETVTVTESDA